MDGTEQDRPMASTPKIAAQTNKKTAMSIRGKPSFSGRAGGRVTFGGSGGAGKVEGVRSGRGSQGLGSALACRWRRRNRKFQRSGPRMAVRAGGGILPHQNARRAGSREKFLGESAVGFWPERVHLAEHGNSGESGFAKDLLYGLNIG